MISGPSHAEINELCLLNTFIGRFLCLISSISDERFLRNPDYAPDGTKTLFWKMMLMLNLLFLLFVKFVSRLFASA